jgi:hypothetical protein
MGDMFTAALDASGSPNHGIFVVAGFVAPDDAWDEFSAKWNIRLMEDGLDYFHMVEYAQSVGLWKSWRGDEARRKRLSADLMGIISSHASRKFGTVVAPSRLKGIDQSLLDHFNVEKYSLAGRTIAADIRRWATRERMGRPIAMVFEHGDEGRGKLMRVFKSDGLPEPVFRKKKEYAPLQAADMLAYEIFNAAEKAERNQLKSMRWALGEFNKLPGEPGIYLDEDINAFAEGLRITREVNKWGEEAQLFTLRHSS